MRRRTVEKVRPRKYIYALYGLSPSRDDNSDNDYWLVDTEHARVNGSRAVAVDHDCL